MKKIFIFIAAVLLFVACSKDEKVEPRFKIDPNATISIKPSHTVMGAPCLLKNGTQHLSDLEIVKQCVGILFRNFKIADNQSISCGFSSCQRDTLSNPPMLKRWVSDLITLDGFGKPYLVQDFMDAEDIVFIRAISRGKDSDGKIRMVADTVAYTPNKLMKSIQIGVRDALLKKDTALAYKIFNTWTFTPITSAEWKALKAKGIE